MQNNRNTGNGGYVSRHNATATPGNARPRLDDDYEATWQAQRRAPVANADAYDRTGYAAAPNGASRAQNDRYNRAQPADEYDYDDDYAETDANPADQYAQAGYAADGYSDESAQYDDYDADYDDESGRVRQYANQSDQRRAANDTYARSTEVRSNGQYRGTSAQYANSRPRTANTRNTSGTRSASGTRSTGGVRSGGQRNSNQRYASQRRAGYSTQHRGKKSGSRAGLIALLATLVLALVVVIPLAIKNMNGGNADSAYSEGVNGGASGGIGGLISGLFATATPVPTEVPTPEPTIAPTPEPTAAPTAEPVASTGRNLDPDKPAIALTFDDGPSKYSKRIMDAIEAVGGRATFFVVGERLDDFSDTLKLEYDRGFQIGMHTYSHVNLRNVSDDEIESQLERTQKLIEKYTGARAKILRPPYGASNAHVKSVVNVPMINWSVDTLDWDSRNADKVVENILNETVDGDIVLMHDLYDSTAEAVERVVGQLVDRGFQLVTVEELFELKGKTLDVGSLYRSAKNAA